MGTVGVWQSPRWGGFWRFWAVRRVWPLWRLWSSGRWVRIRWRRWRWWWGRSPVLLLRREHRVHGASYGFPEYRSHHHLFPVYHRLQLPQGIRCSLLFHPTPLVWLPPLFSALFRFLWSSSRERRSWPESWSLMDFMWLSSLKMMTLKASGTDWFSTLRKSPVYIAKSVGLLLAWIQHTPYRYQFSLQSF